LKQWGASRYFLKIVSIQEKYPWRDAFIPNLSKDLQKELPMKKHYFMSIKQLSMGGAGQFLSIKSIVSYMKEQAVLLLILT
jgi:hypothetical protein